MLEYWGILYSVEKPMNEVTKSLLDIGHQDKKGALLAEPPARLGRN